jgi:hypothetical protein
MSKYYQFLSLEMVPPIQVATVIRSQDGVVGWRYRPEKTILDLLFETDVQTEQERLNAITSGQEIYLVLDGQRKEFHLPTHESILEEIACAAEDLIADATGLEEAFNPSEYVVSADHIQKISSLLERLTAFDEAEASQ